jgi:hypothetical protein
MPTRTLSPNVPAARLAARAASCPDPGDGAAAMLTSLLATGAEPCEALAQAAAACGRDAVLPFLLDAMRTPARKQWKIPIMAMSCLCEMAQWDPELARMGLAAWGTNQVLKEGLNLHSQAWVTSLPEGLTFGPNANLNLCGSGIASLPEGLVVPRGLDLSYSAITTLPQGLKAGIALSLVGSRIQTLPEGLDVDGILELKKCPAWDGHIPADAKARHVSSDRHETAVPLEEWRTLHPNGELADA